MLIVKRRTATQDGYSGPSVLEEAEGVDMATHCIVAIKKIQCSLWQGKDLHTRIQFPIMLACVPERSACHPGVRV